MSEIEVASGVARFYNKGAGTVIKAVTPFGYALADPDTVFDLYAGEASVEVVALKGHVRFVHAATNSKYDVEAGFPSILADQSKVSYGDGKIDPDWGRWNATREDFWRAKAGMGGQAAEYLPPGLRYDNNIFEEYGNWERVSYEGADRWFWRPTVVAGGWSPFTVGRWTYWYGDQTWIPVEPFGYITHHYGNWVYIRNRWYWAPPIVSGRMGSSLLDVGFFWFPGRVSWIHRGTHVGWVPLAPRENYYCHRDWGGPRTVVIGTANVSRFRSSTRDYAYIGQAVVVDRKHYYAGSNYSRVRVTGLKPSGSSTTIGRRRPLTSR